MPHKRKQHTAGPSVEYRQIDSLAPYARNARTHSDAQVAQLATAIETFGWTNPVLADAGGIIAGHGRVMAAQRLYARGLAIRLPGGADLPPGTVPVIDCTGWTEAQRRAYILADNQLALQAGWDEQMLAQELADLQALDCDLGLTGFGEDELSRLLASLDATPEGQTDEDAIPEQALDAPAISQPGDLWLLGRHRLMCGDSTDACAVERLMHGARAALMQTDPPYGVSHVQTKHGIPRSGFSDMADRWEHIKNDDLQDEKLQAFLEGVFRAACAHALRDDAAWYLWHAHLTQGFFAAAAAAAAAADVLLHRQIIWVKPSMVLTRSGMYHWRHEPCFYGWRRGHQPPWYGDKSQTSIWEIKRDQGAVHPTQKPVALWVPGIENHTKSGEVIYEPFAGSGSQVIAAEQTGRVCHAMEMSPHYVDTIVRRWQQFTGKRAVLESSGHPFPEGDA